MKDYYGILELSPNATLDEIRAQYRLMLNAWHPDKHSNPEHKAKAQERTKEITEAYSILSDPPKRAQYDKSRSMPPSESDKQKNQAQTYQPLSQEAETYNEAIELLQDPNANDRSYRDAASLLSIVVTRAEQEFPLARSILALVLTNLKDYKAAEQHANIALKRSPYDFRAQFVRVRIASANMKVLKQQGAMGVLDLLSQGTAATLIGGGMVLTSQMKFKDEVIRLISIFRQLCTTRLPAIEFTYLLERLFEIANFISENQASIPSGKVNVYAEIANAPINSVVFENEAERKEAQRLIRLAQGYALSFK